MLVLSLLFPVPTSAQRFPIPAYKNVQVKTNFPGFTTETVDK